MRTTRQSVRFASERSRVRVSSGPPKSGDKIDVSCEKPDYIGLFCYPNSDFLCTETRIKKRRFLSGTGLEFPKCEYQIHRQIGIKKLSAFFIALKKEKTDMLQKELAKRFRVRYDTSRYNNGWLDVSSDPRGLRL